MSQPEGSILDRLQPLEPLDLKRCQTVSEIVQGMSRCSFGARMLGEVADTLTAAIEQGQRPLIVSDCLSCPILDQLSDDAGLFERYYIDEYTEPDGGSRRTLAVVVGGFTERQGQDMNLKAERTIYVNDQYLCAPGQVRDGYFPDVVFADPQLAMSILAMTLDERLTGRRHGVAELMTYFESCEGTAKAVVHGAHTLHKMLADKDSTNMFTVSGAMTVGKMQLLVADLIDTGRIHYVAATGALMAHGLIEGTGCRHYKYDPSISDEEMAKYGLNRVTDSVEPETNFDHIEEIVRAVLDWFHAGDLRPIGSHVFYREIGIYIAEHYPQVRSILASAFRQHVPVVTPAFIDSELGNDVYVDNVRRERAGGSKLMFDQEEDTRVLFDTATKAQRLGIFTIGGGVPRNNTQNVAPLHEIHNHRLGIDKPACSFHYGVRIDPAQMALGHLSGCTYSEGSSWRKFDFEGPRAEIRADATIAWPFIQRFALEKLGFYAAPSL